MILIRIGNVGQQQVIINCCKLGKFGPYKLGKSHLYRHNSTNNQNLQISCIPFYLQHFTFQHFTLFTIFQPFTILALYLFCFQLFISSCLSLLFIHFSLLFLFVSLISFTIFQQRSLKAFKSVLETCIEELNHFLEYSLSLEIVCWFLNRPTRVPSQQTICKPTLI